MSLVALLPSTGYLLAYTLPLLIISVISTFAGPFLTFDRTRAFRPRPDAGYTEDMPGSFGYSSKHKRFRLKLEGGIGGLMVGYLFGLHAATFLALLIPATSSSASLSHKSFVAVWLLSVIPTTFIAGRWRIAAILFGAISGGATFALSVCVIIHPTLLTRIVFTSVVLPILTVFCLLPIPKTQRCVIRVAYASVGAFGTVLSVALLANVPAWANVWERLWVKNDVEWGTIHEKGLSAAWCFLVVLGFACDCVLHRKFGENPDQTWDSYLAGYAASLPNAADRAGTFKPLSSYWNNFLHKNNPMVKEPNAEAVAMYADTKALLSTPQTPIKLSKQKSMSQPPQFQATRPGFLRKKSTQAAMERLVTRANDGRRRKDRGVKFGADYSSESDDDSDHDSPKVQRPWLGTNVSAVDSTASVTTLVEDDEDLSVPKLNVGKEKARIKRNLGKPDDPAPEYSDFEEDIVEDKNADRKSPEWEPEFLRKHRASIGKAPVPRGFTPSAPSHEPTSSQANSSSSQSTSTPLRPVPATPSLIKAIDRVAKAQEAAYGLSMSDHALSSTNVSSEFSGIMMPTAKPGTVRPGLPAHKSSDAPLEAGMPRPAAIPDSDTNKGHRWQNFWREVKEKAAEH
ncbi:hypothetical protein PUNSTDRAFT_81513 [Punctularia strigosozonata HHB-11173 SS5]|uniref:uncharacterized protein n=1 Tax=Punctularia strigosozonata (strain HHB-11173) TaxID=741275 RepID=UPI000441840D|nr:uncharacterized protein PUNSTDRAFT_81513 [Punctularia strigosozonata HHB-11173 SS5]EIN12345.1 hypothetical protein PUNSTDRAFT_81513 [Punctularia strigosozonata HHB-11173 SS5]